MTTNTDRLVTQLATTILLINHNEHQAAILLLDAIIDEVQARGAHAKLTQLSAAERPNRHRDRAVRAAARMTDEDRALVEAQRNEWYAKRAAMYEAALSITCSTCGQDRGATCLAGSGQPTRPHKVRMDHARTKADPGLPSWMTEAIAAVEEETAW